MEKKGLFFSGTSGLQTPIPKRDFPDVYQDKSRLGYYSLLFNSIEINSSFYKMPRPDTLKKWADQVNGSFKFTFKLWQGITHVKGLDFDQADIEKFFRIIDYIDGKAGCLLVQFPPGITIEFFSQFEKLLTALNKFNDRWKIAVEFRNRSWYEQNVYDLLSGFKAGLVFQDLPLSVTPLIETVEDFVYLRFHGPDGGYRGSYDDAFLSEYSTYISEWMQSERDVYIYFNNTVGSALNNLQTLNSYVKLQ